MAYIYIPAVLLTVLVALGKRLWSEGCAPPSPLLSSQRVADKLGLRRNPAPLVTRQASKSRNKGQVLHCVQRNSLIGESVDTARVCLLGIRAALCFAAPESTQMPHVYEYGESDGACGCAPGPLSLLVTHILPNATVADTWPPHSFSEKKQSHSSSGHAEILHGR